MRKNLPVTGSEYLLQDGAQIVSRTDLNGIITFCNPDFVEASGFNESELMGAPHNILRHPDMPPSAFADLWATLKAGKPWSGMVKNRRKNGDHYWVEANVTPEKRDGQIASYLSVRRKPTRNQVEAAEALYRNVNAGRATLAETGLGARIKRQHLATKIAVASTLIVTLCLVAMNLFSQGQTKSTLDQIMLDNLQAQNRHVIGMVETYNHSLEQSVTLISNLFNAQFTGTFSLDETQTVEVNGKPTPQLKHDGIVLNGNFAAVDRFSAAANGGTVATVFARKGEDFLRVSTSLKKEDGSRAVGTTLDRTHPAYARLLAGQPYIGKASLFGHEYMTRYTPVLDAHGKVIAALFVGLDFSQQFTDLKARLKGIKIGQTGYVYVLDAGKNKGLLVVHPAKEGKNILTAKDADGREFIREMLDKKEGVIRYPWINKELGETSAREKIVVYGEVPAWNWVVGSGSYVEEFTAGSARIGWIFLVAGILTVAILGVFLTLLSRRLVARPLDAVIKNMDEIAQGNYHAPIPTGYRDEIGQVFVALKAMQTKLGFDVAESRRVADETLRIKVALDNSTVGITVSDAEARLVHMTPSARSLLQSLGGIGLDVDSLLGDKLSRLFHEPGAAARFDQAVLSGAQVDMEFNGHHLRLIARPIVDAAGKHLGRVTQWQDRTPEVAVEQEVASLVGAAAAGDFSRRLRSEDKEGFFLQLTEGINRLVETSERGMSDVARVLKALANGDLTQQIEADYHGLFGELKDDANGTTQRLQEIVSQIREATDAINTAAREIASGNTDLSGRTESQAASLQETAASLDEITSTVKQNADNARQANQLARGASDIAMKGGNVVGEVVHTMASIADSSKKIADIISVIDGIAFQTNILALNAAVEAARAGEQGRGFAVVAGEVRSLAQRSANAAREIKTLIGDSVDKVNVGYRQVEQAGSTMKEIVDAVKRVTDIMGEISAASTEQSQGVEQVNQAISQMDEATQQNAALVEEAAAAAESLQDQASGLTQAVAVFRVNGRSGAIAPPAYARPAAAALARPAVAARAPAKAVPRATPTAPARAGADDEWEEF